MIFDEGTNQCAGKSRYSGVGAVGAGVNPYPTPHTKFILKGTIGAEESGIQGGGGRRSIITMK